MVAMSPMTVIFAACLNGIPLSVGTMVKAYPTANARDRASIMVDVMSHPNRKPIAATAASPILHPINHPRTCFAVVHRKLPSNLCALTL